MHLWLKYSVDFTMKCKWLNGYCDNSKFLNKLTVSPWFLWGSFLSWLYYVIYYSVEFTM